MHNTHTHYELFENVFFFFDYTIFSVYFKESTSYFFE